MLIVHQFKVQESKFSYPNHIRKLNPVKDTQPVGHRVGQRAFLKSLTMESTLESNNPSTFTGSKKSELNLSSFCFRILVRI